MNDKPRKTLSIGRKPAPDATTPETADSAPTGIQRTRKRIITRDQLPAAQLAKPKGKAPPKKPARKPAPKKPLIAPSDIRLDNLNAALNGFQVWREHAPLAIGVEREIFQRVAQRKLSASKRVVQRLLYRHTTGRAYLQNILNSSVRLHLDGSEAEPINAMDREHAAGKLGR